MFEGTESEPREEPERGAPVSEDDPAGGASGLTDEDTGAAAATPEIGGQQDQGQTTVPAPDDDVSKGAGLEEGGEAEGQDADVEYGGQGER